MAESRKNTPPSPSSTDLQKWIDEGMCELEYDKKGQLKELVVNFPDGTQQRYAIIESLKKILIEFGFLLNREKVERLPVKLLPSLTNTFKGEADAVDVNFSEYVRRALFAAELDPDSLFTDEVNKKELEYKRGLSSSRWTKPILDELDQSKK